MATQPAQDPALPKFEVPLNDKGGSTSKYWYFFFQGLLQSLLKPSGVTPGSYTNTNLTVNVDGIITAASNGSGGAVSITGGTGLTATPSPIVGTGSLAIANTAVTPGNYTNANITVNQQGQLTAAANGSGGTSPFNVTPDTHGAIPTGVGVGPNDEFESGTSIDTTGARYASATPWTAFNVGVAPTGVTNSVSLGSLVLLSGTTAVGSATIKGYSQPIASPATYVAKVQAFGNAGTLQIDAGIFLSENATGKAVTLDIRIDAAAGITTFVTSWSSPTTGLANLATANANPSTFTDTTARFSGFPMYLQVAVTSTTLAFSFSRSGFPGTFVLLTSFLKTANFTVGPDIIGLYISPDANTAFVQPSAGVFDYFRRTA